MPGPAILMGVGSRAVADYVCMKNGDLAEMYGCFEPNSSADGQSVFITWRSDLFRDVRVLANSVVEGSMLAEAGYRILSLTLADTVANVQEVVLGQYVMKSPQPEDPPGLGDLAQAFGVEAVRFQPDIIFVHGTRAGENLSTYRDLVDHLFNVEWVCDVAADANQCVVLLRKPHAALKGNLVLHDMLEYAMIP